MQNFIKTIINAFKHWTNDKINNSVADWNQNDPSADNYIKNRPFYTEKGSLVTILPKTTLTFTSTGYSGSQFIYDDTSNLGFIEGKTYLVLWDNIEYRCNCISYSGESVGNKYILSNNEINSGEPFFIWNDTRVMTDTIGTHTLEIATINDDTIHKLDSKYLDLPTNLATTDDVNILAANKMNATNPTGTGSFSMNRKSNTSIGNKSVAMGANTTASGSGSCAEGKYTTASGEASHAEGSSTTASGDDSHAEGNDTKASGNQSHAEGNYTQAAGDYSHAEGTNSKLALSITGSANSTNYTISSHSSSIQIGRILNYGTVYAKITAYNSSTLTITTNITLSSTALSNATAYLMMGIAFGESSHAEGDETTASGISSHAEGYNTIASSQADHAEGIETIASGISSHAEGNRTRVTSDSSVKSTSIPIGLRVKGFAGHAEGYGTIAYGACAHTEGNNSTASGDYSHAEGNGTTASGTSSHAEGSNSTASGYSAHAEGKDTIASGEASHTEGYSTEASGYAAHAEGYNTTASGDYSHAEGYNTIANIKYSSASGKYNVTKKEYGLEPTGILEGGTPYSNQYYSDKYEITDDGLFKLINPSSGYTSNHQVSGMYSFRSTNASYTSSEIFRVELSNATNNGYAHIKYKPISKYAHVVGNGTSNTNRSNAHTLDWNGVGWYQGGLQVGGNAQDDGAKNVLLEGDAIQTPSTATVGQTLVVKTVDENGKPVEWETVDPWVLTDESTGIKYKMSLVDSKLTITEVTSE